MAESIKCFRCGVDTGYTDETPVEDKTRSILPTGVDESGRVHFCERCWIQVNGDKLSEN